jgi:hypothetical protein
MPNTSTVVLIVKSLAGAVSLAIGGWFDGSAGS